ncbi:MAG: hypothetical protein IKN96_06190 [Oscillibacter sp.]|nr:hypothetical protein [Oscillibacter sp.]
MENTEYFNALKASLEEALAFERGDKSRCRVSVRKADAPPKADGVARRQPPPRIYPAK